MPAAGFRPTWGCWNPGTDQVVPLEDFRDTPGIIARSAADVALLNKVLSCSSIPRPGLLCWALDPIFTC